jgi:hypothetical protein
MHCGWMLGKVDNGKIKWDQQAQWDKVHTLYSNKAEHMWILQFLTPNMLRMK